MAAKKKKEYLTEREWGLLILYAWKHEEFRRDFQHDPRKAVEETLPKLEPNHKLPKEFHVLKIPPKAPGAKHLFEVALGDSEAVAMPYTCCCC